MWRYRTGMKKQFGEDRFQTNGKDLTPYLKSNRPLQILFVFSKNGKLLPIKSPLNIVYRSESVEAERTLNEMRIKQSYRILVGALPKSD
ncbi:MAG: hypothetical protein ACYDCP_03225 [Thermoplasmataceae archaeon]|jgi:hypothetical protein